MYKKLIKLILLFSVYFLLIYSFEELSKFIFIRDAFLDVNLDYFLFIDTFVSLTLIFICLIYIRKTDLKIGKISMLYYKHIILVLFVVLLFRIFEDPFLRIEVIIKGLKIPDDINSKPYSLLSLVITFTNVVILTAVLEELFFRKILLSVFSKKNMIIGIIVSSFLFAIVHVNYLNDILRLLMFFVFGIISSIIYKRFGLIYSILFHMGYNLIWYLIKIDLIPYWRVLRELNFGYFYWIFISISSILLVYILFRITKKIVLGQITR